MGHDRAEVQDLHHALGAPSLCARRRPHKVLGRVVIQRKLLRIATSRRGAGVVERAGFENRYTLTGIQGSNPCLSVKTRSFDTAFGALGEVSEWLKEHAWKACIRETVSRVRIPPSPFFFPR